MAQKVKLLSVIIPVYNEVNNVMQLISKVHEVDINKELIIVDDCSTDGTSGLLKTIDSVNVKVIFKQKNEGKGAAIRTALKYVLGDVVVIQDADLEYDPQDYLTLMPFITDQGLDVIYGSRFINPENKHSYYTFFLGGQLVTLICNILYGQKLTDEPTCYKMFRTELIQSIPLVSERFGFCPEVTAKIAKKGIKIQETAINYYPRKRDEGKKINWKDGVEAIWLLFKFRITN